MAEPHELLAALRDAMRNAEAQRFDPIESVRHVLRSGLSLPVAPAVLDALPWPLDAVFPSEGVVGDVWLGARMRVPGPEAMRAESGERIRGRATRWTIRALRDGMRPRGPHDLTWRTLCEAEEGVACEDPLPSVAQITSFSRHPSLHVRGYAWLGWLLLHEHGVAVDCDLFELALAEPPQLRVVAIWVISTIAPTRDVRELFEGLLDHGVAEHVRDDALSLLVHLPPAPLRDLAPSVAAISRARGIPCAAWCRLDPSVWPELLAATEEVEPLERTRRIERRYARAGLPIPSHVRTERAQAALQALSHATPWLDTTAVDAIVARAEDPGFDWILRQLGPRARHAVDAIHARPLEASSFARSDRVMLLAALGGERAIAAIEEHLRADPELARYLSPLGEDAVPLLRGALARAATAREREMALWAACSVASSALAPDVWPHLEGDDENVVCWALQALLAADVVHTPLERARVLDAFLRFQPTARAFGPQFYRLAETLAASVIPWLSEALDAGDELLSMRVVRAMGYLRSWAASFLPEVERLIERGGPALRGELARARERIEHPPPLIQPNT